MAGLKAQGQIKEASEKLYNLISILLLFMKQVKIIH